MSTDSQHLFDELESLLSCLAHRDDPDRCTPPETGAIVSFLQVHANELKDMIASTCKPSCELLMFAAEAGCPDIVLRLLDAGARADEHDDMYYELLKNDIIYDMNGDVMDDADIAARLRMMHDTHGLELMMYSGHIASPTLLCVCSDRLECLRVMIEIDSSAHGYTQDCHDSLLHIAALCREPRIVRFLLASGWTLDSHDFNNDGLSPLHACLVSHHDDSTTGLHIVCAMLAALLEHVEDAVTMLRSSGLCDTQSAGQPEPNSDQMLLVATPAPRIRMHVFMCAAARTYTSLPRRVLEYKWFAATALEHSPSELRTLPLDEHVHTGIGDLVYLRDSLRVGASFDHALRYAALEDALCVVGAVMLTDRERWERHSCMEVLRESRTACVTGTSPTLQHWAWMRRLHVVRSRQHMLRREAALRRRQTTAVAPKRVTRAASSKRRRP